jgi:hypothetical protein
MTHRARGVAAGGDDVEVARAGLVVEVGAFAARQAQLLHRSHVR